MLAFLDQSIIRSRNVNVDNQLLLNGLLASDVVGDGNCLQQVISVCLYGTQSHHAALRKAVADHLLTNFVSLFCSAQPTSRDKDAIQKRVNSIRTNGEWVGEDAIVAATDLLQRQIQVFTSHKSSILKCLYQT